MIKPYGNILINQTISNFDNLIINKKNSIDLDSNEFINLNNIALGYYSPLNRFCNFKDYKNIVHLNKINNYTKWTIPILLVLKKRKSLYKKNKFYYLEYKKKIVGAIQAESFFKINKKENNLKIFNTNSKLHPGVKGVNKLKNSFIGGKVYLLNSCSIKDKYFFSPIYFRKKIFSSNFTAFSTRNICHLGHECIHKKIFSNDKKLLVSVIVSEKNKYDSKHIINTYNILKKEKLYKNLKLIKIFMPRLFAGPKEAYLQAIIFQNLGIKQFVIGRDHAGVKDFYAKYASQKFFSKKNYLKIDILKTKEHIFCIHCNKFGFEKGVFCKNDKKKCKYVSIDGNFVKRQILLKNFEILKKYLNINILNYVKKNVISGKI